MDIQNRQYIDCEEQHKKEILKFNEENIYNRIDLEMFKEFMLKIQPFIVCAEMRVDKYFFSVKD